MVSKCVLSDIIWYCFKEVKNVFDLSDGWKWRAADAPCDLEKKTNPERGTLCLKTAQ